MWKFEVFKDEDRGWRWRLVQCNSVIAIESSVLFDRRSDAKRAAELARQEIGAAVVNLL